MFQLLKAQGLGSVPSTHSCQADSQPLQLQLSASAALYVSVFAYVHLPK